MAKHTHLKLKDRLTIASSLEKGCSFKAIGMAMTKDSRLFQGGSRSSYL